MLHYLDLHDALQAAELLALQRLAYQQEAELIGYAQLPPLRESLPELMDCGERVLVWREAGVLLAALGYLHDAQGLDICRLMVAPTAQRRGLGRRLLAELAKQQRPMRVMTAAANLPAIALYQQAGFVLRREIVLPDGLKLVALQHP